MLTKRPKDKTIWGDCLLFETQNLKYDDLLNEEMQALDTA